MVDVNNIICGYEQEVVEWIKNHYKELGYDQIIEENSQKTPDFIMQKGTQKVRVEVEIYAKSFFKHGHKEEQVDEVFCIINDAKLPIKTTEIKQLRLWYHLSADELIDLFKILPDKILINHKTGELIHHFQDDWIGLTKEKELLLRQRFRENHHPERWTQN